MSTPVGDLRRRATMGSGAPLVRSPRHRSAPRVRRLARDRGVALEGLTGTGPLGRVVAADVLRAADVRSPHVHSPRVRRLAEERGVALDGVTGTGPRGRVAPADVLRLPRVTTGSDESQMMGREEAPAPRELPSPRRSNHDFAMVEVDVTGIDTAGLVASIVVASVAALREVGTETNADAVDVALHRHAGGGTTTQLLHSAQGLGVDGVRGVLGRPRQPEQGGAGTEAGRRSGRRFAVHDLTEGPVGRASLAPAPGEVASVVVAAPTARPSVVVADGVPSLAVRYVLTLDVAWDGDRLDTAAALQLLSGIHRRLDRTRGASGTR